MMEAQLQDDTPDFRAAESLRLNPTILKISGRSAAHPAHPETNADAIAYSAPHGYAVVIDGEGEAAHKNKGFIVSSLARRLGLIKNNTDPETAGLGISRALIESSEKVAKEIPNGSVAATIAKFLEIDGKRMAIIGRVGNCQAYLLRDGRLHPITDTAESSQLDHVLLQEGDRIVMTTRGVDGYLTSEEIEQALAEKRFYPAAAVVEKALAKIGHPRSTDSPAHDISAVVVEVNPRSPETNSQAMERMSAFIPTELDRETRTSANRDLPRGRLRFLNSIPTFFDRHRTITQLTLGFVTGMGMRLVLRGSFAALGASGMPLLVGSGAAAGAVWGAYKEYQKQGTLNRQVGWAFTKGAIAGGVGATVGMFAPEIFQGASDLVQGKVDLATLRSAFMNFLNKDQILSLIQSQPIDISSIQAPQIEPPKIDFQGLADRLTSLLPHQDIALPSTNAVPVPGLVDKAIPASSDLPDIWEDTKTLLQEKADMLKAARESATLPVDNPPLAASALPNPPIADDLTTLMQERADILQAARESLTDQPAPAEDEIKTLLQEKADIRGQSADIVQSLSPTILEGFDLNQLPDTIPISAGQTDSGVMLEALKKIGGDRLPANEFQNLLNRLTTESCRLSGISSVAYGVSGEGFIDERFVPIGKQIVVKKAFELALAA